MVHRVIYTKPYDAEVEYLETDGYSFIDTGILTSSVLDIESKAQMVNANNPKILFGGETNSNLHNFALYLSEYNIHNFIFKWNGTERGSGPINTSPHIFRTVTTDTHKNVYMDTYLKIRNAERGNDFISTRTMTLFKRNQIGNGTKSTAGLRIYYFKIYDNGVLVRDFIPVRVGQVGYMFDRVSKQLFGNKGTGNFILGSDVANPVPNIRRVFRFGNKRFVMPMPYDSKVEYLESTGTQYIDTGVIIDSETAFAGTSVDFQAVNINNGTCVIAGSVLSEGANRYKNLNLLVHKNKFYIDGAGWRFNNNINDITLRTIATATGTAKGISRKQFLLFARYVVGLGASTSNSGCRIFSCKIYKNEILICDLIPVRRGNVGYMYDRVSGNLFGNSGTGQFILGNDIND